MMHAKPTWLAEGSEKRERVQKMFADLAPVYDRMNGVMTLRNDQRWRWIAVKELELKPGQAVADICSGTGAFLYPLRHVVGPNGLVVGLDFCAPMLHQAKARKAPGFLAASDACALPIASASMDAATIGWGLRNVADLHLAIREVYRILKPGGRFANLDMTQPRSGLIRAASQRILDPFVRTMGASRGDAYAYLTESARRFATREELADAMVAAGFTDVRFRDFAFGHVCLHVATKPK